VPGVNHDGASNAEQLYVSEPGRLIFPRVTDSVGRYSDHELLPFEVRSGIGGG
jgi:hypothetical protein